MPIVATYSLLFMFNLVHTPTETYKPSHNLEEAEQNMPSFSSAFMAMLQILSGDPAILFL